MVLLFGALPSLPPPSLQNLQPIIFLQLQNSQTDLIPEGRAWEKEGECVIESDGNMTYKTHSWDRNIVFVLFSSPGLPGMIPSLSHSIYEYVNSRLAWMPLPLVAQSRKIVTCARWNSFGYVCANTLTIHFVGVQFFVGILRWGLWDSTQFCLSPLTQK